MCKHIIDTFHCIVCNTDLSEVPPTRLTSRCDHARQNGLEWKECPYAVVTHCRKKAEELWNDRAKMCEGCFEQVRGWHNWSRNE